MGLDEVERQLQERLDALGPAPRAELIHVLMLPDFDRADAIGSYWGEPQDRTFSSFWSTARRTERSGRCWSGCCVRAIAGGVRPLLLAVADGHLERSAVIRVEARRTLERPTVPEPEVQARGSWRRMEPL